MAVSMSNSLTDIQKLSTKLLSTLDEAVFFNELAIFLNSVVAAEQVIACKVLDDNSAVVISKNGKIVSSGKLLKIGEGITGHVIRSKRPYSSNNVARDPLYVKDNSDEAVAAEMGIPVAHEGIVIGTVHFQMLSEEKKFSRDDMTKVLAALTELTAPIANMKMYLTAKSLNEVLMKKLEEKEKELIRQASGYASSEVAMIKEDTIIGKSAEIRALLQVADKVAKSEVNLIIKGEAGSGKELIAKRIHCRSSRAAKPFVTVACNSLVEEDLLTELFGRELNDFSGKIIKGAFERANGGTVLLKNIDSLKPAIQVKLQNALKEKTVYRMNGQKAVKIDARVIASTNKTLIDEVNANHFLEDLFYTLNTIEVVVPGLKNRAEDIELLANFFLNKGKDAAAQKSFAPSAIAAMVAYKWPSNVRELINIVERAYILSDGKIIEKQHLGEQVANSEQELKVEEEVVEIDFKEMTLCELEKQHICNTLDYLAGNKTKTAKALGITVKTLYNKLHTYGMIDLKEEA